MFTTEIPIFDEDGKLESVIHMSPRGTEIIPVKKMNEYDSVFHELFRDKPNGSTVTYTNEPGDVLEVVKLSDDKFDAIHHFAKGGQEAVRKIIGKLVVAEIFMGHYDLNTMTETNTFIFDDSDKSEITAEYYVEDDEDGNSVTHVHIEKVTPDGDIKTHDRYQIIQGVTDTEKDNASEFKPKTNSDERN